MAEHFLSLVEHLVFSISAHFWTKANYCSDGNKQTNKKKQLPNITVEHLFFSISARFWPKPIIAQMETNKQTKKQLPNNTVERFVFFHLHPNFGIPKKASTFCFFFDFRPKAVWWTLLLLFASPFYCNQRFCIQRLFLLKGFSVAIKKREVYLCWQDFFLLGFGNKGFGQQIKNIFFRWSKWYLESEKKRAKNTSSASHHVA